jgi:hypothetical protein
MCWNKWFRHWYCIYSTSERYSLKGHLKVRRLFYSVWYSTKFPPIWNFMNYTFQCYPSYNSTAHLLCNIRLINTASSFYKCTHIFIYYLSLLKYVWRKEQELISLAIRRYFTIIMCLLINGKGREFLQIC